MRAKSNPGNFVGERLAVEEIAVSVKTVLYTLVFLRGYRLLIKNGDWKSVAHPCRYLQYSRVLTSRSIL